MIILVTRSVDLCSKTYFVAQSCATKRQFTKLFFCPVSSAVRKSTGALMHRKETPCPSPRATPRSCSTAHVQLASRILSVHKEARQRKTLKPPRSSRLFLSPHLLHPARPLRRAGDERVFTDGAKAAYSLSFPPSPHLHPITTGRLCTAPADWTRSRRGAGASRSLASGAQSSSCCRKKKATVC